MNLFRFLGMAILATAMLATAVEAAEKRDTIGKVLKDKSITIANNLASPPWRFRDVNNNPAGISIDLNRMIAARLGVDLEMIDVEWAGLIPALLTRKTDILATTMSTTFKRAQKVLFTKEKWYKAGVVAFVPPETSLQSWVDLNAEGKRVAVVAGTVSAEVAKEYFPKAEVKSYPLDVDTYQALKTKRADAALNDSVQIKLLSSEYGFTTLKQPSELIKTDTWAFAVRPGDECTWHYLNYFVEKSREYGHLEALLRYWVDGEQWKKDFLEKNDGVSAARQELVNFLGIADYTPYVGENNRLTMR